MEHGRAEQRTPSDTKVLRREVKRIFDDMGWENLAWLEEWDGQVLEELQEVLDEEQYQALLDQLEELDLG